MAEIAALVVGTALVVTVTLSAVRTVILPRAATDPLGRVVFRSLYAFFRTLAVASPSYRGRDRVMALYAPVAMLGLIVAWLSVAITGYTFLFWFAGVGGWRQAFHTSGSSLLTLGFAPVDGTGQTLLAFSEAVIGLGLIALMITYLPSMYQSFNRRESRVGLLEVRAGAPPSGVELLERFHAIGWLEHMTEDLERWEHWFVDIEETHTSLPMLAFFRSPHPDRSWITAAGAALDGASLALACLDLPPMPQAALTIRSGYVALRRIADFFGIAYDSDPKPDDPISVARSEFDAAYRRLVEAGAPVKADQDQAWRDFAGWRVNYDTVLLALCALTMAPYAPWSSDRSPPRWRQPSRLRRWGRWLSNPAE